jgi:hypothetical protein
MVYLLYKGIQDIFLTESPDFTYFKTMYYRDTESLSRGYEIPFDNPGSETLICTLPRNGDYIERITLKVIVPQLTNQTDTYWTRDTTLISGNMTGFDSSGGIVFIVKVIGNLATSNPISGWVTASGDVLVTTKDPISFQFCSNTLVSYVVFDSKELATFWGFRYNPVPLFGGYIKFFIRDLYTVNIPTQVNATQFFLTNVSNWFYGYGPVSNFTYNGVNRGTVSVNLKDANTFTILSDDVHMIGGFASTSYDGTTLTLIPNQLSNGDIKPVITYSWNSTITELSDSKYFFGTLSVRLPGLFRYSNCTSSWSDSNYIVYNSDFIQGGFITSTSGIPATTQYTNTFASQSTWQDSGWKLGDPYTTSSSYVEGVIEKYIQVASLVIGGQVVQEMDPFYIRYLKESTYSYKNRPVLNLVENGDNNIIDFNRIYYYELPFFKPVPLHALTKQDIQVRIKLNPIKAQFTSTLIVNYDIFQVKLPSTYELVVPQVSFFLRDLDVRGPMTKLVTAPKEFTFKVNGEKYCDTEYTVISSYENDFNVPLNSNTCIVNGTINMSRIRYQESVSNIYSETKNILGIANGLSGLYYDTTQAHLWPVFSGSINGPVPPPSTKYLFDAIPNSVSVMQSFYSVRLCNSRYAGPVLRLSQTNGTEADFFTDDKQTYLRTSQGVSILDWSGGNNVYVSVWYDQTINANHIIQPIYQLRPQLVQYRVTNWVISFSNPKQLNINDNNTAAAQWMQHTVPIVSPQQIIVNIYPTGGINPQNAPDGTQENSFIISTTEGKGLTFSRNPSQIFGTYSDNINGDSRDTWFDVDNLRNIDWRVNNNFVDGTYGLNLPLATRTVFNERWNLLLSWGVDNPPIENSRFVLIGTEGVSVTIARSYNGYMTELSFLNGTTLAQDYSKYYPLFR